MRSAIAPIPIAMLLAGCAQAPDQLSCIVQEQASRGRTLTVSAELSPPNSEGVRQLQGTTEYLEGSGRVQILTSGVYLPANEEGRLELLTFGELPEGRGKLNISAQPGHPAFIRRDTAAMVLTGQQTVQDGVPATISCQVRAA